jgi:hypothetical protein
LYLPTAPFQELPSFAPLRHLTMPTHPGKRFPVTGTTEDRHTTKRGRSESDGAKSDVTTKRLRRPAQLPEMFDDAAKDDTRYMINRAIRQPRPGRRSFAVGAPQIIDLTQDDDVDPVIPSQQPKGKRRHAHSEAKNGPKPFLRRTPPRQSERPRRSVFFSGPPVVEKGEEGELKWAVAPRKSGGQRLHQEHIYRGPMRFQSSAAPTPLPPPAVMFTFEEAKAVLANPPPNNITYDLPTGAFIPYPVTRSYHLGAMGRYGVQPTTASTRLPYQPRDDGARDSRSDYYK